MNDITNILCGKRHVTPERGFERDGETWAACPICGQEDRVEDIFGEAAKYRVDKSIPPLPVFQSSHMTVKDFPKQSYRWVTGD